MGSVTGQSGEIKHVMNFKDFSDAATILYREAAARIVLGIGL